MNKSRTRQIKKLKGKIEVIISDKGNPLEKREKAERILEKIEIRLSDKTTDDFLDDNSLKLFCGIEDDDHYYYNDYDDDLFQQEPYY